MNKKTVKDKMVRVSSDTTYSEIGKNPKVR